MDGKGSVRGKHRTTPSRRDPTSAKIPSYHPPRAKFPKSDSSQHQNLLHDPGCIEMRNSLLKDESCDITSIPNCDLEKLSAHLKEYSAWCGLKRLYSKAQQADDLNERIRVERINRISLREQSSYDMQDLEEAHRLIELRFADELKEFDDETEDKLERLELSQSHKLETFEAKWRDEMPRKYRKPSARLLNMIASERQYAKQGKYAEAQSMQTEVDKLMEIETAAAQVKLNSDYREAKAKLDAKLKEERKLFDETRLHWRDVVLERQREELLALENRKIVIEAKTSKPEVIRPEEKFDGSTAKIRRKYAEMENSLLPVLVPPNNDDAVAQEEEQAKRKRTRSREIRKRLEEREQAEEDMMISTSTTSSATEKTTSRTSSNRARTYRTEAHERESSRLRK